MFTYYSSINLSIDISYCKEKSKTNFLSIVYQLFIDCLSIVSFFWQINNSDYNEIYLYFHSIIMSIETKIEKQVSPLEEFKNELSDLKKEIEEVKPDFEVTEGFDITSKNGVELGFHFDGAQSANYEISYSIWEKWEILVHIDGSAEDPAIMLEKKIDKTLSYKDQNELKQNFSIDMRNSIKSTISWKGWIIDVKQETERRIEKKIDMTSNWIIYSMQEKKDVVEKDNMIALKLDKRSHGLIVIDEGFFHKGYIWVINGKKFEIDNKNPLSFCNSVWTNIPQEIRKDISEKEKFETLYPKLIKAYTVLEK